VLRSDSKKPPETPTRDLESLTMSTTDNSVTATTKHDHRCSSGEYSDIEVFVEHFVSMEDVSSLFHNSGILLDSPNKKEITYSLRPSCVARTRTARGMALGECVVDEQSKGMCHGSLCFRNDFTFHGLLKASTSWRISCCPGSTPFIQHCHRTLTMRK
jgi:hypothetical protein